MFDLQLIFRYKVKLSLISVTIFSLGGFEEEKEKKPQKPRAIDDVFLTLTMLKKKISSF